jgi:hypothetical protein
VILLTQALLVIWVTAHFVSPRLKRLALVAGLISLIPLYQGMSIAMALRGLWGDPSATTLQLLILSLSGHTPTALRRGWRAPLGIVVLAALLYPMALGLGDFDPYRLGFQPWLLVAVLGPTAIAAWWRGQPLYLWLLAVDLLAFAANLQESTNLWDTLLDPLLAVAALVLLIRNCWNKIRYDR